MRAIVCNEPGEFEIRDVDRPVPSSHEALVRVESTTIYGSDLKILEGEYPQVRYPHVPGHEWSGEIVTVGDNVRRFDPGERVSAEPHVGCGECQRCLEGLYTLCEHYGEPEWGHAHIGFTVDGGLAEYVAADSRALHRMPESLSFDQGAFCEVVGVMLWAIQRAGITSGDTVLVVRPGALGMAAVQLVKSHGATQTVLMGTRGSRLEPALELGADEVIDVTKGDPLKSAVKSACDGGEPDVVLEFAGTGTAAQQAIRLARPGGSIVLAGATGPGPGLEIELQEIVSKQKTVYGSVANPKWVYQRGLEVIRAGHVDVEALATHHYPLDNFDSAIETFRNRTDGAYRVILHP